MQLLSVYTNVTFDRKLSGDNIHISPESKHGKGKTTTINVNSNLLYVDTVHSAASLGKVTASVVVGK